MSNEESDESNNESTTRSYPPPFPALGNSPLVPGFQSLTFATTDSMVAHVLHACQNRMQRDRMLVIKRNTSERHPSDDVMLNLSVGSTLLNLEGMASGDIRMPSVMVDLLEPMGRFGHAMNLVSQWEVRVPGCHRRGSPLRVDRENTMLMPICTSEFDDHNYSYIAMYHLNQTNKGANMDWGDVCRGDRRVLVIRAKVFLLFGLIVHAGVMLDKDVADALED